MVNAVRTTFTTHDDLVLSCVTLWTMTLRRAIDWDGFYNTRDLGGLPTRSGGATRHGAFIRSAGLRFVTDAGWGAARDFGIRTIVDLRNDDEIGRDKRLAPPDLARVEVPLDDVADVQFWDQMYNEGIAGSPLYYRPFLARSPERCAAAVTALARTDGGVLFHCAVGRDRTGLISLLLLALANVEPSAIAEDYALSTAALIPLFAAMRVNDQGPFVEAALRSRGTTIRSAILEVLEGFDAERYLLDAGVSATDLEVIRGRLTTVRDSRQGR